MPKPKPVRFIALSDVCGTGPGVILVKLADGRELWLPSHYRDGSDILNFVPGGVFVPTWLYKKIEAGHVSSANN